MMPTRLLIMARAPQPGLAKTRLIPALGTDGAAQIAREMLERTLAAALAADCAAVELCVTPDFADPAWRNIALPAGVIVSDQGEGDLGERMARAAARAIAAGERVLLVGTDCAEMNADLLREAAQQLNEADAVLFPVLDGGYALLGLSRFDASLFGNIAWSTAEVARVTQTRIAALGWQLHLGKTLHDIDEPTDLLHWKSN